MRFGSYWRGFLLLLSVSLFSCQILFRNVADRTEVCETLSGFGMSLEAVMSILLTRQILFGFRSDHRPGWYAMIMVQTILFAFGLYTSVILGISASDSTFWNGSICYPTAFPTIVLVYSLISTVHIAGSLCQEARQYNNDEQAEVQGFEPLGRRRGLSVDELQSIEIQKVANSDELCPICLDPCQGNVKMIHCGHKFHANCIDTWLKLNNSCALCRQTINPTLPE